MLVSAYCITHLRCCMRTRASYFEREPLPRMIGNVEQKAQKQSARHIEPKQRHQYASCGASHVLPVQENLRATRTQAAWRALRPRGRFREYARSRTTAAVARSAT